MMLFWGFPFFGIILMFLLIRVAVKVLRKYFVRSDRPASHRVFPFEDDFFLSGNEAYATPPRDGLENKIFKLAYDLKGRLTLSDVVIGTNLTMKEAEEFLNHLADGVHVRMEVEDDGSVYYDFPEFKRRFESKSTNPAPSNP